MEELYDKISKRRLCRIYDLKIGEYFYTYEGIIVQLLDYNYDPNNPDEIQYVVRKLGHNNKFDIKNTGKDVANQYFYRYTTRDYSSFNAGFRAALKLIRPYIIPVILNHIGLDNMVKEHMKMTELYQNWKKNLDDLW